MRNDRFWDTYPDRLLTTYGLLMPDDASELVDGFVQRYSDGGWISRWSSPGYANLMTGTESDAAFADAYTKGVELPQSDGHLPGRPERTRRSPAPAPRRTPTSAGRALGSSIFRGWTDTEVAEGTSWGLEGGIDDSPWPTRPSSSPRNRG